VPALRLSRRSAGLTFPGTDPEASAEAEVEIVNGRELAPPRRHMKPDEDLIDGKYAPA
jgi:hypothetical protein